METTSIRPHSGTLYDVRYLIAVLSFACAAAAQNPARPGTFEGRPSLELSNGVLQLTVLVQGTSMAAVSLADDPAKLNPMWDPARMAREAGQKGGAGGGTGHFVCVDGFGPTSAEERAAGLQGHGEAHRQTFEVVRAAKDGRTATLTLRATLPIVQETFTRTYRIVDGENVVTVESELENLLGFDRPVNWAEHATVGSPFLASNETVVDISGTRSQTRPYTGAARMGAIERRLKSGENFTWPMAPGVDGRPVDLRLTPANPRYLDHAATLVDPGRPHGWLTALNLPKRLILGYLWKREEYPWIQYWGNYPPNGKFARGLEFSSQPYDLPRREVISTGPMFDAPVYRWLPAKSKIGSRFLMFYARVPEGMKKVDDVRLENGQIVIEDRTSGKKVTLAASMGL
jgi:hypothetical protein